jgi:3-hydroxyacyl-CoA dehydrogenase/3-hydroxy-2-methylbutyryl-CoA dehydrogenase
MELAGKTCVVTGGTSGLGEATARMAVREGATVAILDVASATGEKLADELGDAAMFVPTDVTDQEAVRAAIDLVADTHGALHVCVNAAGIGSAARVISRADGEMFPLDLFRTVIDVNLVGLFDVVRNACRVMARNEEGPDGERGLIINVGSIAGYEGQAGQAAYSASKGGVIAMTLPLARELSSWGIRVLTVCPGVFDTGMLAGLDDKVRDRLAGIPVYPKRPGAPAEFAQLVKAIAENVMLNGEVIRIDAATRLSHG